MLESLTHGSKKTPNKDLNQKDMLALETFHTKSFYWSYLLNLNGKLYIQCSQHCNSDNLVLCNMYWLLVLNGVENKYFVASVYFSSILRTSNSVHVNHTGIEPTSTKQWGKSYCSRKHWQPLMGFVWDYPLHHANPLATVSLIQNLVLKCWPQFSPKCPNSVNKGFIVCLTLKRALTFF